jgi:predicted DNA-binding transcriptional regulator AlpA
MSRANRPDPIAYPPRGLCRDEAARYIGVSSTKFDDLVTRGDMPKPKRIDGRVIWDRFALDMAFNALPEGRGNVVDMAMGRA